MASLRKKADPGWLAVPKRQSTRKMPKEQSDKLDQSM